MDLSNEELAELIAERERSAEIAALEQGAALAAAYLIDSADLLARAQDEPSWLVKGAVPLDSITYIAGRPGSGKTWLAYDLAMAVLKKRKWLGFETVKTGPVLVLNLDSPTPECASRFKRLALWGGAPIWFHSIGAKRPPNDKLPALLLLPDAFDALDAIVSTLKPVLIIIDSLRKAHTKEESSSRDMAEVTNALRWLSIGRAVVVIHHIRKPSTSKAKDDDEEDEALGMRGSSEIEASADVIIGVRGSDPTTVEGVARWAKVRSWSMPDNVRAFRLDGSALIGESPLLAALRDGPLTRDELRKRLGLTQSQVKQLVDQAIADGELEEKRSDDGAKKVGLT